MPYSSRMPVAVHILLATALFDGEHKVTSGFLASSIGVNPVIVRNTLGKLKAAGLVSVDAGVGGAHLKKAPDEITLLDVFRAVEEDKSLFHFHENPNPDCPVGRNIHAVLGEELETVETEMAERLRAITLRTLMTDMERAIEKQQI